MSTANRSLAVRLSDPEEPGLVGIFVIMPRLEVVEMAAAAGFDFVVIDFEHGSFGVDILPGLAAAGAAAGIFVVARIAEVRAASIGAVLDAGADGVLVPHVDTVEEARLVSDAASHPPDGRRSLHPWVRGASYGLPRLRGNAESEEPVVIAMIESGRGLAALPAMLKNNRLHGVFLGLVDLAAEIGAPVDSKQVADAVEEAMGSTLAAGCAVGLHASSAEQAKVWIRAGARFVTVRCDTDVLGAGLQQVVEELHQD